MNFLSVIFKGFYILPTWSLDVFVNGHDFLLDVGDFN